jgi:hypothetical protein
MKKTSTSAFFALLFFFCAGGTHAHALRHTSKHLPLYNTPTATYNTPPETSTVNLPSRLWLDLRYDDETASQTAIAYLPQATLGVDFGYDAARFMENNVLSVYTLIEGTPFVIQARPSFSVSDMVQLGYDAPMSGTFRLSVNRADGIFSQGQRILIKDNTTGIITDLSTEALVFNSESGTFNDRFTVGYSVEVLQTPAYTLPQAFSVYKSGQGLALESGSTIQQVTIYDTSGRILYKNNTINNNNLYIDAIATQKQLLFIETQTVSGKIRKKIIY